MISSVVLDILDSWYISDVIDKTSNGEHIAYPSQVKEVDWASTTCTYGWSVQGLWPSISDPHQNMIGKPVCVHNTTKVNNLLAMGDDCGSVKLYNHPVISKRVCKFEFF